MLNMLVKIILHNYEMVYIDDNNNNFGMVGQSGLELQVCRCLHVPRSIFIANILMDIYIYMYVCVCECVCVCLFA